MKMTGPGLRARLGNPYFQGVLTMAHGMYGWMLPQQVPAASIDDLAAENERMVTDLWEAIASRNEPER